MKIDKIRDPHRHRRSMLRFETAGGRRVLVGYCGATFGLKEMLDYIEGVQQSVGTTITQDHIRHLITCGLRATYYDDGSLGREFREVMGGTSDRPQDYAEALEEYDDDWYGLCEQLIMEGAVT